MKSFTRNLFLAVCICVLIATADAAPTSGSVPQGLGRTRSSRSGVRRSSSVRMSQEEFHHTFGASPVLYIESPPSPSPPAPLDRKQNKSKLSKFHGAVKRIVRSLLPSKPKRASFYPLPPQAQNPPYSTTNAEPSARQSLPYPDPPAQNSQPASNLRAQRFSFFPDHSRYSEIPEGSEYSNPNSSTEHLTASHANDDFGDEEEGGMAGATLVNNSRVGSRMNLASN